MIETLIWFRIISKRISFGEELMVFAEIGEIGENFAYVFESHSPILFDHWGNLYLWTFVRFSLIFIEPNLI